MMKRKKERKRVKKKVKVKRVKKECKSNKEAQRVTVFSKRRKRLAY